MVVFSDREDPSVAFGEGAVSLESEVFGQGNAEERGRAPGTHATRFFRAAPQPNSTTPTQGSPNRPGAAVPSPQIQIGTERLLPPSIPTAETPQQPERRDLTSQVAQGAEALVEIGADRSLRDQANMSALDYAKSQGYDDIVALLEDGS